MSSGCYVLASLDHVIHYSSWLTTRAHTDFTETDCYKIVHNIHICLNVHFVHFSPTALLLRTRKQYLLNVPRDPAIDRQGESHDHWLSEKIQPIRPLNRRIPADQRPTNRWNTEARSKFTPSVWNKNTHMQFKIDSLIAIKFYFPPCLSIRWRLTCSEPTNKPLSTCTVLPLGLVVSSSSSSCCCWPLVDSFRLGNDVQDKKTTFRSQVLMMAVEPNGVFDVFALHLRLFYGDFRLSDRFLDNKSPQVWSIPNRTKQ